MTVLTVADLTTATIEGSGVFDTLMRANKAHLESEFTKGRIKGSEYATVYLGSLESVMGTALAFLLQKDKQALELELLAKQIELADKQVAKAQVELEILQAQVLKVPAEIALLQAQRDLAAQQALNAVIEGTVLTAQKCKLDAEFDLLILTKAKTTQETDLLMWKTNSEKAQTLAAGVDDNSVIGKQKSLYAAQTSGFARDAEQKVAKLMVDSWSVRRTTDEATVASDVSGVSVEGVPYVANYLGDASVGRAVTKLLNGVGA